MHKGLRSPVFDDIYFSPDDGLAETRHVFLENNNLPDAWAGRDWFCVGETGFGTGLNFLSLWTLFEETSAPGAVLDYVSFEKYPLAPEEILRALKPWADRFGGRLERLVESYPLRVSGWHRVEFGRVRLTLIFDDVNDAFPRFVCPRGVDAWFLDGFAPAKNPQMWTPIVFENMARLSKAGTSFASFTAAGIVKDGLRAAGFAVEKRKGFGRKRDMIAGYFTKGVQVDIKPVKHIAILGGGLAGAACAFVLKRRGFAPVVFERAAQLATGASGNFQGICNPRFTAQRTAESDFYTAAFSNIQKQVPNAMRCGSLHLMTNEDKAKRFAATLENWRWDAAHMRLVDAPQASEIAGIAVPVGALFLSDSIQLSPVEVVQTWASGCEVRLGVAPDDKDLNDFDAVIHANGVEVLQTAMADLPIHTVRGQVIAVAQTEVSKNLRTNLCYGGYIGAGRDGGHVVGSTFQKWLTHCDVLEEDTKEILARLFAAVPGLDFSTQDVTRARASLRCAAADHFPVIGPVPGREGHYMSTAHGSHGVISSLTGAMMIADMIEGGVCCLPGDTVEALDSQRFLRRAARRGKNVIQ
jgi:tRNA 5-methylaminomethyl-2-thiouridine biosynthesis bifunctional protein